MKLVPDTLTVPPASTGLGVSVIPGTENGHCGVGLAGSEVGVEVGFDVGVDVGLEVGRDVEPGVGVELWLPLGLGETPGV